MKTVSTIVLATSLLSLVACGNKNSSSSDAPTSNPLTIENGRYQATLSPINSHLAGDVSGTATVRVKGDAMTFEVKVNGSPAQVVHMQNIHVANECPTLASDENNDGVIDAVEGAKSYGGVVIPLDNDLRTQVEKNAKFPTADFTGNYFYRQNVSMVEMMADLMAKDSDESDNVVKVSSGLNLTGRQIVIYGVDKDVALPETVAEAFGMSKHKGLPIACGSFIKIAAEEGSNTNGGKEE